MLAGLLVRPIRSPSHAVLGMLLLAISACSGGIRDVGRSTPLQPSQGAKPIQTKRNDPARGEPSTWMLLQELPSLRRVTPRERSQHLGGDVESETLANHLADAYPNRDRSEKLPAGAVLVTAHYRVGSDAPVVYFAMIKQRAGFDPGGGDWEYLVIAPTGDIEQRGRLAPCARCHAEAPSDSLFGQVR